MFLFPFLKQHHRRSRYKHNDPRRFLGQLAIVTMTINRYHRGQIKVEATLFKAEISPETYGTIRPQSIVKVVGIHSDNLNVLIVQSVDVNERGEEEEQEPVFYPSWMEVPA